jgi:hypothetical protein
VYHEQANAIGSDFPTENPTVGYLSNKWGAPMIDTVTLRWPVLLSGKQLYRKNGWVHRKKTFPDGTYRVKYWCRKKVTESCSAHLIYYPPNDRYPEPYLSLEISLPHLFFGTNAILLKNQDELDSAVEMLAEIVRQQLTFLPPINLWEGVLHRIDLTYDHNVGLRVSDFLSAFSQLQYPNRKTVVYPGEGVQFKSDAATTKFYGKHKQSIRPEAKGILRQETTFRRAYYIGRQMQVDPWRIMTKPVLRDFSFPWAEMILMRDLERLGLNDSIIPNRCFAREQLVKHYGAAKGCKLFGIWESLQSCTREELIEKGLKLRTLQNYLKQIKDAGVALTIGNSSVPLPSLVIEWSADSCAES